MISKAQPGGFGESATLYSIFYTLYPILCILYSALHNIHHMLYTMYYILCTTASMPYTLRYIYIYIYIYIYTYIWWFAFRVEAQKCHSGLFTFAGLLAQGFVPPIWRKVGRARF